LAEAKAKRTRKPKTVAIPVVRDSTFRRAFVDTALIVGVGSSVEVSCLQAGVTLKAINQSDQNVGFDGDEVLTELLRLRFVWPAAVAMAMNILRIGIATGNVDAQATLKRLAALKSEEPADGD
jgi:hypothetical protein